MKKKVQILLIFCILLSIIIISILIITQNTNPKKIQKNESIFYGEWNVKVSPGDDNWTWTFYSNKTLKTSFSYEPAVIDWTKWYIKDEEFYTSSSNVFQTFERARIQINENGNSIIIKNRSSLSAGEITYTLTKN